MSIYSNKSKTAKAVSGFVGFAMALSLVLGGAVAPVQAQSVSDLTAQINSLLSMITTLQAQLSSLQGGTPGSVSTGYVFNTDLTMNSTGQDVMNLQKVLNGIDGAQLATVGAGSPGNETSFFGGITRAGVIKFQQKYGITPAVGYVGPITRAKLNSMSTGPVGPIGPGPTVPGVAGTLTVSAASQPSASLAPQSAARIPFTRVTLTAGGSDVTVNSITVERTGLAQDSAFSGVVLLDQNGLQIGVAKTLNSNHQVVVGEAFVVPAGTSRTYTIAGNMNASLTNFAGQVASLTVVGINTGATVVGSLPITGAFHTINASLSLGSATLAVSSFDPNTSSTKEIGTTGYKFAGIRVTSGSAEQVRLHSVRWNQTGSVSSNDLANLKTVVDGTSYDMVVSKDGKYYTASFGSGILIDKGFSKDIHVQGDIVGGNASGRTVVFDIDKSSDIYVSGELFGYGITPSASSTATASDSSSQFTTGTPFFDGSVVTISAGSVTTITKSNTVAAQNVAVNVPNQPLGGFEIDVKGEAISVQTIAITVATSGTGAGLLTNVSIVDQNGATVAGPVDASGIGATLTFTDTITFPLGKSTYSVKGQLPSTFTNGGTIVLSTTPSSGWTTVRGEVSGNTLTLTQGALSMNTMTVKAAALALSVSSQPSAQTIVSGLNGFTFSNIQLDASQSGEDVRFSTIPLKITATGDSTNLTACQLFDGTTGLNTGSNVVNPTNVQGYAASDVTFTLDQSLTIPKGTVKTLAVKCNLSGSATSSSTFKWGLSASPSITVTGITSSNDVTETVTANVGPTMTIASAGSLTITNSPSTPSLSISAAGSTGVTANVVTFRSTNEAVNLERIGLTLTNSASSSAADLVKVSIYDGATMVGEAVFTGSSTNATSTLSSFDADDKPINFVELPKDQDKDLTIKVDLANIGTNQSGTQGHLIAVNVDGNSNTQGSGLSSGTKIDASGSTSASGIRVFKSYPILALDTLPASGIADGRLMRFKVTANSSGPVGLLKFSTTISTTSASVTNVNIFGFTDSSYSQPVSGVTNSGQLMAANRCTSGCTSNPTLEFYAQTSAGATTTIQVPASGTRYFEVRGTVTGSATTYSITTTLDGDSAFPSLAAFMGNEATIDADANDDFIWSPNATTTSLVSHVDWTNGFTIQGLPSSGLIQTRSN